MRALKLVPSASSLRLLRTILQDRPSLPHANHPFLGRCPAFHTSTAWLGIRKHRLSDVGEGTKEVQIIQWFVEEGARVEEWAKLCEVQSDKAAVEITSQYSGVITKLHFEKDDIVQVGDVMVEFEVDGVADEEPPAQEDVEQEGDSGNISEMEKAAEGGIAEDVGAAESIQIPEKMESSPKTRRGPSKHASLATPAVRGLLKEHDIAIEDVEGSGRDGRVTKEDVYRYLEQGAAPIQEEATTSTKPSLGSKQVETPQKLTSVQSAMFKSMTASLSIPHFLYSDSINITRLSAARTRLNVIRNPDTTPKLSYLPFVVKAVSLALNQYPLLNARLDIATDSKKPQLQMRSGHNIGIAMDTPAGLVVPVIKNVNSRTILSIMQEMQRLSQLGRAGKLNNADLSGGTITVSNIGSIGGDVVAPVIVEGQLAIMGMGKVKAVPVFAADGSIERAEMMGVSWSADHRVVDGATMARMATVVQGYLEDPASMMLEMS